MTIRLKYSERTGSKHWGLGVLQGHACNHADSQFGAYQTPAGASWDWPIGYGLCHLDGTEADAAACQPLVSEIPSFSRARSRARSRVAA